MAEPAGMAPTPFRIDCTNVTAPSIEVDGRDVTGGVHALSVTLEPGRTIPVLTVQTTGPGVFEGVADVQVVDDTAPYREIAAAVRALDPQEVSSRALAAMGLGDSDLTSAVLQVVANEIEALA